MSSNENATPSKGENVDQNSIGSHDTSRQLEWTTADPPASSTNNGVAELNGIGHGRTDNGKSDSEAETVVLSGKEEDPMRTTRKAIKHEDNSEDERSVKPVPRKAKRHDGDSVDTGEPHGSRKPSLKRKRTAQDFVATEAVQGAISSNLSSTCSSPAPQTISDKHHGSDSDRSRSSPPAEEDVRKQKIRIRKRKLERASDQEDRRRRGKSDPSSVAVNGKERRESRRVKEHASSTVRSESPPTHQHLRTHSTQLTGSQTSIRKKKAPPSLSIDIDRRTSEDPGAESDESDYQRNRPQLYKSASTDEPMTSKLSHKKILDRSGRTPVARACANDNIEQLTNELKERPQHLEVPDYAQNTPLQIAALEGFVNIVQYLISQGCNVDCKNVDGDTPLIDAVENGHLEVVNLLLEAGADPHRRNGKGFEPLELVKVENDDYDEIRAALVAAKGKHNQRRQSEDHASGAKDNDGASASAPGGSPTDSLQTQGSKAGSGGGDPSAKSHTGRSGTIEGDTSRRRTARSEATREDLLWITPTPAKLRDAASKGDIVVAAHCLNTLGVGADIESMIAAARGGHDDVLDILIAMGYPEQDPDPLESSKYKAGYNTPMLAAIGGGNTQVVKLLLSQPEFDPTRRVYRDYTYYELAKQRQGSNWQEEFEILKEAYDNNTNDGTRRSAHSTPRKVRTKRPSSSSPHALSRSDRPGEKVKEERPRIPSSQQHLHPKDNERKGSSSAFSDREANILAPAKLKNRSGRSVSDAGSTVNSKHEPGIKPRRRLLSKNEMQSDHDTKRRADSAVGKFSSPSHEKPGRTSTDSPVSTLDDKMKPRDAPSTHREGGKKRLRTSTSPHGSISEISKNRGIVKKRKRQKADSQEDAFEQDPGGSLPRGPAMVAHMVSSPEPVLSPIKTPGTIAHMVSSPEPVMSPIKTSGTAPVANMLANPVSPMLASSPVNMRRSINSPIGSLDSTLQQDVAVFKFSSPPGNEPAMHVPGQADERAPTRTDGLGKLEHPVATGLPDRPDAQVIAEERRHNEEILREDAAVKTREREARAAAEQEEASLKAQREEAELQRQMQTEREEQEARAAKKRNDELQMQIRRAEQERQAKEKEERRRAELEMREEQRRARLQQEEELRRRECLPYGLRRAAELDPELARDPGWIYHWLPLYYVTTGDLDLDCDSEEAEERWISNVQVAPILANRDLGLSQCKSF